MPQREQPAPQPNYFAEASVAAQYDRARPQYHAQAVEWLCRAAGQPYFARAVDVACGCGHSSQALAQVCDDVLAIDSAAEMLAQAQPAPRVRYQQGTAEALDVAEGSVELVVVASALHWFDQPRFYAECRRALAPGGVLLVYNDHFTAHAPSVPQVKHWMRSTFARRYRAPRRGMRDIYLPVAEACGFRLLHSGSFEHSEGYSAQEFRDYLLTRSNTLAALRRGRETRAEAEAWLSEELSQIVPGSTPIDFLFKCNLWLLAPARGAGCAPPRP